MDTTSKSQTIPLDTLHNLDSASLKHLAKTIRNAGPRHAKFLLLPAAIYSPETKFGFGLGTSVTFYTIADSDTRASNIQFLGLYTLRSQTVLGLEGSIYLPHENYIFHFRISYSKFPDKFWGLGNNSPDAAEEDYSFSQHYILLQPMRRVYRHFYMGLNAETQQVSNISHPANDLFTKQNVLGRDGGTVNGLGFIAAWDDRNNAFCPNKGLYAEVLFSNFSRQIGSDFNYSHFEMDARKFIAITARQVLALQLFGSFNYGEVPFRNLGTVGGGNIMRGYYEGRYREKCLIAYQAEYRLPLFWRFGLVGFAAVGQVQSRPAQFAVDQFHLAYGAGLRFAVKKREKLNMRLDYGLAPGSSGIYVTLGEAF